MDTQIKKYRPRKVEPAACGMNSQDRPIVNSSVAHPDPDPTFHFDADPDLLVTLMRIHIRIQLNTLMRIRMQTRIQPFNLMRTRIRIRIRIHNTGLQDTDRGQDTDNFMYFNCYENEF
jgi:hypothetical protein